MQPQMNLKYKSSIFISPDESQLLNMIKSKNRFSHEIYPY